MVKSPTTPKYRGSLYYQPKQCTFSSEKKIPHNQKLTIPFISSLIPPKWVPTQWPPRNNAPATKVLVIFTLFNFKVPSNLCSSGEAVRYLTTQPRPPPTGGWVLGFFWGTKATEIDISYCKMYPILPCDPGILPYLGILSPDLLPKSSKIWIPSVWPGKGFEECKIDTRWTRC